MDNIEQRVRKIVAEQLGVNEAEIKNESSFVDDLGADRDVEGADRLVADDQLRVEGERAGDADALALPAGESVGIAAEMFDGEADLPG